MTGQPRLASMALGHQSALVRMYLLLDPPLQIDQLLLSHWPFLCVPCQRLHDHIRPMVSHPLPRSHLPSTPVSAQAIHVYDSFLEAVEKYRLVARPSLYAGKRHRPLISKEGCLPSANTQRTIYSRENDPILVVPSLPLICSNNLFRVCRPPRRSSVKTPLRERDPTKVPLRSGGRRSSSTIWSPRNSRTSLRPSSRRNRELTKPESLVNASRQSLSLYVNRATGAR